jgi:hypothetical protein
MMQSFTLMYENNQYMSDYIMQIALFDLLLIEIE